jgi:type IV fimbrial biogenesis protein FimT
MTALAVLAVLLGLGVPAFTNMMRANQIAAESNNLIAAMTLARSEAVKRGTRVSVCPADGNDCSDAADWNGGWLVFADDFGNPGELDPSDEILQMWSPPSNGVEVDSTATAVTFNRTARAELPEAFTISKDGCTGDQRRAVEVDWSGRVSLTRESCDSEDADAEEPIE